MYGSIDADKSKGDPLLPEREPSTYESRRLRKRASARRASAARDGPQKGLSRRQLMALQHHDDQNQGQPVMQSLFHGDKDKKKHHDHGKKMSTATAKRKSAVAPIDIETLEGLVPGNGNNYSANTPLKSASPDQKRNSKASKSGEPPHKDTKKHEKFHHSWLYVLLHPNSTHSYSAWYKWIMSVIIVVDVGFFVASTEDSWLLGYPDIFYYEEGLVSTIFMIEYLCRVLVAPESHKAREQNQPNWLARINYMKTVPALVDALAALPFFLELPTGFDLPNLTWIRFFRLVRILKTDSFARSMDTVWRVIHYNREILYVALNMCIILVVVTAVLMYYLRPQNPADAEQFSSIMATMYLSALMLTGQGQPEGELPWYTKMMILVTSVFSVGMFAIPASMLTWGFEAEAERCARKARQKYVAELSQGQGNGENEDDYENFFYVSSSSSSEGSTTDEEYLDIIAGGEEPGSDESGEEDKKEDEVIKQLIRTFQTSDTDASGTLSMDEFIELMTDPSISSQHLTIVGMATSMGLLVKRVHHLEAEIAGNNRKLDQILNMMQNQQR